MKGLELQRVRPAIAEGLRLARERGRAVLVSRSEVLVELPDLFELFTAAEQRAAARFLAMRPAESSALLGIGCCDELVVRNAAELRELRANAQHLLEDIFEPNVSEPGARRGGAKLVGGIAFAAWPVETRDPAWRRFGPARFTLPELLFERRDGRSTLTWSLRVRPDEGEVELSQRALARWEQLLDKPVLPAATETQIEAPPGSDLAQRYVAAAQRMLAAITAGKCEKVVLADVERLHVRGARPSERVLRSLCESHPGCLIFAQGLERATFLGATPELLVQLQGRDVRAAAVAGTSRTGDRLQDSGKDRREHDFVVRAIEAVLNERCEALEVPSQPGLLGAGRAQHLLTEVRGRLREPAHVLDLLERLHPTPAVCGTPRAAALSLIRAHERFDRGWYAGPIGWLDARGDGEFHVALRCGLLLDDEMRLFAGAGIVAGSLPAAEAAETRLKLSALREALERACAR